MKALSLFIISVGMAITLNAQTDERTKLEALLKRQKSYALAGNDTYTYNDSLSAYFYHCGWEYSYRYTVLLYMTESLITNQKSVYNFDWKDIVSIETDYNAGVIKLTSRPNAITYEYREYGQKEWARNTVSNLKLLFGGGAPQLAADINEAVGLLKTIIRLCGGGEVKVTDSLDRFKDK